MLVAVATAFHAAAISAAIVVRFAVELPKAPEIVAVPVSPSTVRPTTSSAARTVLDTVAALPTPVEESLSAYKVMSTEEEPPT